MKHVQVALPGFPKNDSGYFHLTPRGWIRKDTEPFPDDRVETWSYDMECGSEADKEHVHLACIWVDAVPASRLRHLRKLFGDEPLSPTPGRQVVLDCRA